MLIAPLVGHFDLSKGGFDAITALGKIPHHAHLVGAPRKGLRPLLKPHFGGCPGRSAGEIPVSYY